MNRHQKIIIIFIILAAFIGGFTVNQFVRSRGIHFWRSRAVPAEEKKVVWSIGIYKGKSPFDLISPNNVHNPVLTAKDVSDIAAEFIADPFMVQENGTWYLFFEVMNAKTREGEIGFATSDDGFTWTYKQIIVNEPFHLSYPYVFKFRNTYYMIPESGHANSIRLYEAIDFPIKWSFKGTLLKGQHFVDTSVVNFNDKWWLFTSNSFYSDNLYLYYADKLTGPWREHPKSPVIMGNPHIARPGGRVLVFNGRLYRFTQDDSQTYGTAVRAFEITKITNRDYEEKEVMQDPILKPAGSGWNEKGMHNVDPHQLSNGSWIACVDGF